MPYIIEACAYCSREATDYYEYPSTYLIVAFRGKIVPICPGHLVILSARYPQPIAKE